MRVSLFVYLLFRLSVRLSGMSVKLPSVEDSILARYIIMIINLRIKNTPGHAGWDELDDTPGKLSSWDLPTPGSRGREDDSSIRSADLKWDKPSTRRDKFNRLQKIRMIDMELGREEIN